MIRAALMLGVLAVLSGCGEADTDPGPGGVTVGEAKALDQAAEMLDQQRLPNEVLVEPGTEPGESAAPTAAIE